MFLGESEFFEKGRWFGRDAWYTDRSAPVKNGFLESQRFERGRVLLDRSAHLLKLLHPIFIFKFSVKWAYFRHRRCSIAALLNYARFRTLVICGTLRAEEHTLGGRVAVTETSRQQTHVCPT